MAVAASEVLGGNDGDGIASFGFYKQYLAVIVGKSESAVTGFLAFEGYHFGRVLVENKHLNSEAKVLDRKAGRGLTEPTPD